MSQHWDVQSSEEGHRAHRFEGKLILLGAEFTPGLGGVQFSNRNYQDAVDHWRLGYEEACVCRRSRDV